MAQKKQKKKKNFWKDNKISIIGFAILIVVLGGLFGVNGIINWVQEKREMIPSEKVKVATLKYMEMPAVEVTAGVTLAETLPPSVDTSKEYDVDNLMFAYFYSSLKAEKEYEMAQQGTTVNRHYWASATVTDDDGNEVNARQWLIDTTVNQCKQVILLEDLAKSSGFELSQKEKDDLQAEIDTQLEEAYGSSYETSLGESWNSSDEWRDARNQIILGTAYMSYADYIDTSIRVETISQYLENNPETEEVTEEGIQEYYDANLESEFTTHKAQHILLKNTDAEGKSLSNKKLKKQKKLAKKIADQINNGADMDELMKKYTEDVDAEGKPNNDGIYEVVEAEGNYDAQFTQYILEHKVGDKVGVVEGAYGYHVIKILDVKETPFNEAKKTIRRNLVEMALMTRAEQMEAELDEGALVPYYAKLADYEETTETE